MPVHGTDLRLAHATGVRQSVGKSQMVERACALGLFRHGLGGDREVWRGRCREVGASSSGLCFPNSHQRGRLILATLTSRTLPIHSPVPPSAWVQRDVTRKHVPEVQLCKTVQDTTDRAAPPAPFDRPPGRRNLGPREGKALALSFWPRPPAPPGAPGAPAAQSAQRRLRAAPRFASDPVALHRPPPPPPREASHGRTKGSSLAGMVLGLRFVVFPGLAVAGKLVTKAASSRLGVPGG